MLTDGLSFSVRIRSQINIRRFLGCCAQFFDDLGLCRNDGIVGRKIIFNIYTQLALWQIFDMTDRSFDSVVLAQIPTDCFCLGRWFNDYQWLCHRRAHTIPSQDKIPWKIVVDQILPKFLRHNWGCGQRPVSGKRFPGSLLILQILQSLCRDFPVSGVLNRAFPSLTVDHKFAEYRIHYLNIPCRIESLHLFWAIPRFWFLRRIAASAPA